MTKHTHGPWMAIPTSTGAISINVAPGVPIATVGGAGWHLGEETARANALLISAAPDLLEAHDPDTLEAIADEIECFKHSARSASLRRIARQARAAIAKAEGTT